MNTATLEVQIDMCPNGDADAMRLEYDVYLREGYIEPNDEHLVLENRDYPEFIHFVARVDGRAIGALRLVTDARPRHGAFRLGSFRHFAIQKWATDLLHSADQHRIVEVGTMVIDPDFRGGNTYAQLFQKAFEYAVMSRVHYALSTIDEGFFHRLLKRGLPFREMGETRHYMGSNTVPAIIDVEQLMRMMFGPQTSTAAARPAAAPASVRSMRPAMAS
jgi:hypothetical protein